MKVKGLIIAIVSLLAGFASLADSPRLEGLQGSTYNPPTNAEIFWGATNELPKKLWTYKVVPQEFSMTVITNLMSLCGFEWANMNKKPDSSIPDKNLFRFVDKRENWTRYLEVAPTLGWIEYNSDSTSKASTNSVPDKSEVEKLALDVLFLMGIDRSLLCDKHSGYESVQGKLSLDGQRLSTNVISRGISFARQIDGIESRNSAAFMIVFGSSNKISHFSLSWRNLLPHEAHFVYTQDEIINLIRTGQTELPMQSYDVRGIDKATKLTVIDISIRYFDNVGHKSLDYSYPFAAVKVQANLEGTNTATLFLQCPILTTNIFRIESIKPPATN